MEFGAARPSRGAREFETYLRERLDAHRDSRRNRRAGCGRRRVRRAVRIDHLSGAVFARIT